MTLKKNIINMTPGELEAWASSHKDTTATGFSLLRGALLTVAGQSEYHARQARAFLTEFMLRDGALRDALDAFVVHRWSDNDTRFLEATRAMNEASAAALATQQAADGWLQGVRHLADTTPARPPLRQG